jgi:DNA-binding LytR/AlgR family response regulator
MVLLIVIDDLANRLLVKNQVKNINGIETIIESDSAEDALFLIMDKNPDLIIATDLLPKKNGFELASLVRKYMPKLPFIMLSTNSLHAVDAIRNRVFDFLVYPFSGEKLVNSVKNALVEIENSSKRNQKKAVTKSKISINTTTGFLMNEVEELLYCLADGAYTKLYFSNGSAEFTCYNLGKLEKILSEFNFVRINRSTIINLKKVRLVDRKKETIMLGNGNYSVEFKVSRLIFSNLKDYNLL